MKFSTVMLVALSSLVSANLFWGNSSDEGATGSGSASGFLGFGGSDDKNASSNSNSLGESVEGKAEDVKEKGEDGSSSGFLGKGSSTDSSGLFGGSTTSKSNMGESESTCDGCGEDTVNPGKENKSNFWGKDKADE